MSEPAQPLPSFDTIEAALRVTTEFLARELVAPGDTPPDWSEFEWAVARAVAAMQGISACLAHRLRWQGPAHWRSFLRDQAEQGIRRQVRIDALLERIDILTRHHRIAVVALKGSALREYHLHLPGERPMGDVDLLVRPADLDGLILLLPRLGFRHSYSTRRHAVLTPLAGRTDTGYGEHVDNPVRIEVHTAVAESLPVQSVNITAQLWPRVPAPGLNRYASTAALMRHLLLHCAGNMRARASRLIQLRDIALLAAHLRAHDWDELLEDSRETPAAWWALPPLLLASSYFPDTIPAAVLAALRPRCPPLLLRSMRRSTLTDLSWSNLRIQAFPGIEWSRTPLEAMRFAKSRLLPDRTALAELKAASEASQPVVQKTPWYGISHAERILRWVVTRPARVQTLYSVRAAHAERFVPDSAAERP